MVRVRHAMWARGCTGGVQITKIANAHCVPVCGGWETALYYVCFSCVFKQSFHSCQKENVKGGGGRGLNVPAASAAALSRPCTCSCIEGCSCAAAAAAGSSASFTTFYLFFPIHLHLFNVLLLFLCLYLVHHKRSCVQQETKTHQKNTHVRSSLLGFGRTLCWAEIQMDTGR